MRRYSFVFFVFFLCQVGLADNHKDHMTKIIGKNISLAFSDHSIAGSVKNTLVFGSQSTTYFGSTVHYQRQRSDKQYVEFKKIDNIFQGYVAKTKANPEAHNIELELLKIEHEKQIIHILINGEKVQVHVQSDGKRGHHFINPKYSLTYQNEKIEFFIQDGQACYGCSVNLIFMILGAYLS